MKYVNGRNIFGAGPSKEIPCLTGVGKPTTATAGAVGCLYMDTATGALYKCTKAVDGVYTWTQEAGLYYTPVVTQPSDTTMRIAFRPSVSGAPTPAPVVVELPVGSSDTVENGYIAQDTAPVNTNLLWIDTSDNDEEYVPDRPSAPTVAKASLPNVVLMGDSITDNKDDHGWWVDIIQEYVEFVSLSNYAVGYARWTLASDTVEDLTTHTHTPASWNVIWNQVNRLKRDTDNGTTPIPDAIIILAGTNDVSLNQTMGDVDTAFDGNSILDKSFADIANMAQSIRYTCEYIKTLYPDTQIILATPLQRKDQGEKAWTCRDIIIGCAKNLSLVVIDQMAECGIYGYAESVTAYHLSDNVHPTQSAGSRLIARYLAKQFPQKILQ